MFVWWRDVLRESTLEGHHTKVVQLGLRYGFILFIVSEVMFLFAFFRASSHSSLAPTVEIGAGAANIRDSSCYIRAGNSDKSSSVIRFIVATVSLAERINRLSKLVDSIIWVSLIAPSSYAPGFHGFHVIMTWIRFILSLGLYRLVEEYMKEQKRALRIQLGRHQRIGAFQRIPVAFPSSFNYYIEKVLFRILFPTNLSVFWHINSGIEEIMADHVHQEMTRNWILVYLRLFLLIVIKDVFLSLISFPNKSKNLMDRTNSSLAAMKDIALAEGRFSYLLSFRQELFFNKGLELSSLREEYGMGLVKL
ncbi:Cytochrome c oxidase subunit 3, partial [Cucurbita argyrosperma subsp. argyrosperma]